MQEVRKMQQVVLSRHSRLLLLLSLITATLLRHFMSISLKRTTLIMVCVPGWRLRNREAEGKRGSRTRLALAYTRKKFLIPLSSHDHSVVNIISCKTGDLLELNMYSQLVKLENRKVLAAFKEGECLIQPKKALGKRLCPIYLLVRGLLCGAQCPRSWAHLMGKKMVTKRCQKIWQSHDRPSVRPWKVVVFFFAKYTFFGVLVAVTV